MAISHKELMLDKAIATFENHAAKTLDFCPDEWASNALGETHIAMANALKEFKKVILLSEHK